MRYSIALLCVFFIGLTAFSTYQDPKMGSFTDSRDGQTYKTVEIGDQTWMAENLKFKDVKKSILANSNHGRFYNWSTVMGLKKNIIKIVFLRMPQCLIREFVLKVGVFLI